MAGDKCVFGMRLFLPRFFHLCRDLQHLHQRKDARKGHKEHREGWGHRQPDTYSELCPSTCSQRIIICPGKGTGL